MPKEAPHQMKKKKNQDDLTYIKECVFEIEEIFISKHR